MAGRLLLQVEGGLCNRYRVLLSGLAFCEATGRELVVCWPIVRVPVLSRLLGNGYFNSFGARFGDLWKTEINEISLKDWNIFANNINGNCSFPPDPHAKEDLLIVKSCQPFFCDEAYSVEHYSSRLELLPELQSMYEIALKGYFNNKPTIGVHIRHFRAHKKTLEASPVIWFEKQMGEIISIHNNCNFFLSCDDPAISKLLHKKFANKIFEQKTVAAFNSKEAIQKALLDLFLLAKTDLILGSYWSSFSEIAMLLQGKKGYRDSANQVGNFQ